MYDGAGGAGNFLAVERSVCGRRWRLRAGDVRRRSYSPSGLALPEIVGRLLAQRGIDYDQAPGFLAPRLRDQLPDPSHLRDMDVAAIRLVRAVREGETIAVFGDYDVDGATSAALLARFFAAVGGRTRIYVPDRLREGYGPNTSALLRLHVGRGARRRHRRLRDECASAARRCRCSRARGHRRRSPRRRAAAAMRDGDRQPEPARRGEPAWGSGGGRRGVSARGRGQSRAAPGGLVRRRAYGTRPDGLARSGSARHRLRRCPACGIEPRLR